MGSVTRYSFVPPGRVHSFAGYSSVETTVPGHFPQSLVTPFQANASNCTLRAAALFTRVANKRDTRRARTEKSMLSYLSKYLVYIFQRSCLLICCNKRVYSVIFLVSVFFKILLLVYRLSLPVSLFFFIFVIIKGFKHIYGLATSRTTTANAIRSTWEIMSATSSLFFFVGGGVSVAFVGASVTFVGLSVTCSIVGD